MIEILKYIFLGLVQGIAEVLPISSSAHLVIVSDVFGINTPASFEVFLHIASLIAVLIFLRKKLWQLIKGFFGYIFKRKEEYKKDFMYCIYVVVSTLIVVIATLIFGNYSDKVANMLWLVGLLLVINAILLFVLTQIKGNRTREELNIKDSIVIGAFQCLGVMPGISRSGSCLCGAFARKIDKETAADYAFILFVPAMVGATILNLKDLLGLFSDSSLIGYYLLSFFVTLVITYVAFAFLLKIIRKGKLNYFGYYCLVVGALVFIYGVLK